VVFLGVVTKRAGSGGLKRRSLQKSRWISKGGKSLEGKEGKGSALQHVGLEEKGRGGLEVLLGANKSCRGKCKKEASKVYGEGERN